jgi:DedD protein
MEKHRILWVIFSLSLFLVVILAGGLYFLRPETQAASPDTARTASSADQFDPFEFVKGTPELPGLAPGTEDKAADELILVVGEPEAEGSAVIEVEKPVPAAESPRALPVARAPQERPAPGQTPAPPVSKPAPASAPERKAAPREVRVIEYWIQTGSYQSHSRAEAVAVNLSERGLTGTISTRSIEGETYFRVRIGPYSDRREAEKFLSWIRELSGFESSYISQVSSRRSVSN